MNRYKVKLVKTYIFDLDGKDKNSILEQIDYINKETKILDLPCVEKSMKIKMKKIGFKKIKKNESNV